MVTNKIKLIRQFLTGIYVLILILFSTVFSNSQTPNYQFRQISIYEGLSQNMINAILQDRNGFMWFGTKDGLNRFDGYSCKIYKSDLFNKKSISDNHVTCLYEDDRGNIWVGTRLGGLNLYDAGEDSFLKVTEGILDKNVIISSITGNSKDGLWLTTLEGGIIGLNIIYNQKDKSPVVTINKIPSKAEIKNGKVHHVLLYGKSIWNIKKEGLSIYASNTMNLDESQNNFPTYKIYENGKFVPKKRDEKISPYRNILFSITKDYKGDLWLSGQEGIYRFDADKKEFLFYKIEGWVKSVTSIQNRSGEREIWTGSYLNGLMIINTVTGELKTFGYKNFSNLGALDGLVTSIYNGRDGTIWLGTNGRGVIYYSPSHSLFENSVSGNKYKELSTSSIYSIFPFSNAGEYNIVINTFKNFTLYDKNNKVLNSNSRYFSRVTRQGPDGELWLGGTIGLLKYNPKTYNYINVDPNSGIILSIFIDKSIVWYTTPETLKAYDMDKKVLKSFKLTDSYGTNSLQIHESLYSTIQSDIDNTLWIGTVNGLYHFDKKKEKLIAHYKNDPSDEKSLNSDEIKSILPDPVDPDRFLWVGTPAGLNRMDKNSKNSVHYSTKDGLPNNTVYGILSDKTGNLWLSTNSGLSVFNTKKETFLNFDVNNGLQSNEFNTGAYYKTSDGEMYFGGINGFNRFYPEEIKLPVSKIPMVISEIKILGDDKNFNFSKEKKNYLNYDENNIMITLSSLDFSSPEKIRYAYRIFNNDTSWIMLDNNRTLALSNLSPGEYVFQAKGTDAFGRWGNAIVEMKFVISRPWWNSIIAQIIYLFTTAAVLYLVWGQYKRRMIQKNQLENERKQGAYLLELDKAKTHFLTNITHEFRTPLTMILGLTDGHSSSDDKDLSGITKKNEDIHRNGKQLLNLVDQMLELSKLEFGKQEVELKAGNLILFIQQIVFSFESFAAGKNIKLKHDVHFTERDYKFDSEKLQQVLTNLISNAIKFTNTPESICVRSTMVNHGNIQYLRVEVEDKGIGISADELVHVFDRFHRVKSHESQQIPGTGIGLALAKELVELMGGNISASSTPGKGSIFSFEIRVEKADSFEQVSSDFDEVGKIEPENIFESFNYDQQEKISGGVEVDHGPEAMTILVVEDNDDVRDYIHSCIKEKFRVVTAVDGRDGLRKTVEHIPDIIVSDVMMPEMDGFELCDEVKNNSLTNHIPFILLTARIDDTSRVQGLKKGADAYLAKPFDREELLLTLKNMSQLISRIRSTYTNLFTNTQNAENSISIDHFIIQAFEVLENNYTREEYSVEQLAQELFMSRSQLFRKIKALTGNSPSTFMRSFRLKKAKELLEAHPHMNISEVAYASGFSSPKYFSNVYLEEFGVRPR